MVFVHKGLDYIIHILEEDGNNTFPAERLTETLLSNLNIDVSGVHGEDENDVIEALSNEDLRHLFEMNKAEIFKVLSEKLKISGTANFSNSVSNLTQKGSNLSAVMVGLMRNTPTARFSMAGLIMAEHLPSPICLHAAWRGPIAAACNARPIITHLGRPRQ